ncbi:hypothetical protein [Alsobacter sp. R-9]
MRESVLAAVRVGAHLEALLDAIDDLMQHAYDEAGVQIPDSHFTALRDWASTLAANIAGQPVGGSPLEQWCRVGITLEAAANARAKAEA